jgi:hypothetical protein
MGRLDLTAFLTLFVSVLTDQVYHPDFLLTVLRHFNTTTLQDPLS